MAQKTLRVRMPDGSIREVRVGNVAETETPGYAKTALMSGLQGATFGFFDELTGGVGSLFGKDYKEVRDRIRRETQAGKSENPVTAMVSEIAGAVPMALLPAGLIGKGMSAGKGVLAASGVGAGEGALYGYGASASEDPAQQARHAVTGGVLGGTIGGAIPGATRGAQHVMHTLFPAIGKDPAKRAIGQTLEKVGETPENINKAIQRGENLTAADVSPELRQVLKFATDEATAARAPAVAGIAARLSAQKQRAVERLTRKQTADAATAIQNYRAKNAVPMQSAYDEAYKSTINTRGDKAFADLIQRPAVRTAFTDSLSNYANRHGRMIQGDDIPVEVFDKVSGVIGDAAAAARKAGEGTKATTLNSAKAAWDTYLEKKAPQSLLKARAIARKNFEFEDAVKQGQDYLKTPMQEITDTLVAYEKNPTLAKAYRTGVVDTVMKKLSRLGEGTSWQKAFTDAEKKRLERIMGPRFDGFWKALGDERKIAKTQQVVSERIAVDQLPAVRQVPLFELNPRGRVLQTASRIGQQKISRRAHEDLIRMLTSPQGLKGVPTADLIHAIGRHRLGAAAGPLPQVGQEPYLAGQ